MGLSGKGWWREAVFYQVYPRSFADSNGDGAGDLKGITGRLPYLGWLGMGAIWLCPFYPSPQEDFGYDITDYEGVDPLFGTLEDFDELLREAHAHDIRVILDFVPNHTSREHPWFWESRSSRANPKRDWYVWADPKPDGSPPNNWRGGADYSEEGSSWTFDETTSQYYLSTFSPNQPDLNWHNEGVRAAMHAAMRFWLERGVDGFRLDMLDFLGKDELLRDEEPLAEGEDERTYDARSRYRLGRPETLDYVREIRALVDSYGAEDGVDRVLVGELIYHPPVERLAAYGGPGLLDLPSNFRLTILPFDAREIGDFVDAYDAACRREGAWPNWCLGNHDTPRVSRLGERRARLATMLLLTLRGTPFLYYGDEIGMENVEIPPEKRLDAWVVPEVGVGRDGTRTPMQWDASPNAGFCPPAVQPWLPVSPHYRDANVEAQARAPSSMLALTRGLLALRRSRPALLRGSYFQREAPEGCLVYERRLGDERILVVFNFSDQERKVGLDGEESPRVLLSTGLDREEAKVSSPFRLAGHEGVVMEVSHGPAGPR